MRTSLKHKMVLIFLIAVMQLSTGGMVLEAAPLPSVTSPVTEADAQTPAQPLAVPEFAATGNLLTSISFECGDSSTGTRVLLPVLLRNTVAAQHARQSQPVQAPPLVSEINAVAPALDRSVGYDIYAATQFLYSGSSPIQTGVAQGTIDRRCVVVLRGNVITRDGQPLEGVRITIKDHPEFGETLTRADGLFDLALNGGETIVLEYQKAGYLPVQRRVPTQRRQFKVVEAVVMIQPDAKATAIDPDSNAAFQVAQGSIETDRSGARQATLLFPQGAFDSLKAANVSLGSAAQLTVRATEYTVGTTGASAMPGDLPPNSGYTYAVEFSVDEAGTGQVSFDKPVINYTENFIGAPVGSPVPVGYYDRDAAEWVPGGNGRVLQIVSISGGLANIDVTGDGVADSGAALTDLGITDAERQQLATLYTAGQELWRVALPHFSPWDFNWPFGPPTDAKEPPTAPDGNDQPNPCTESGSVIDCDAQTLGESLPVIGTPFTLNYTSGRVAGWKAGNILDIPIVVGDVPASLKSIYLEAQVGGQMTVRRWGRNGVGRSFGVTGLYSGTIEALAPNLSHRLVWDGRDGYGRATNGRPLASVMLRYVYDYAFYTARDDFDQSFAQFGGDIFITSGREYCQYMNYPPASDVAFDFCGINLVASYSRPLGYWDAAAVDGLGAWTLDVHHGYDPNDGTLHLGDGTDLRPSDIGPVVTAVTPDPSLINYLGDLAIAPDGTVLFHDVFEKKVMRVQPDGSLAHIAGNGSQGFPTGDGGPATAATLGWYVTALATGPDGSLYIAGTYDNYNAGLIHRVAPDGTISLFAGTHFTATNLPNGDGGPALAARLNRPEDILVGPDGSLYISETPQYRQAGGNYSRIRKIAPNGIISTITGAGANTDVNADLVGVPALEWGALPAPGRLAFGPDSSLYIPHPAHNTVSQIGADGILRRMAGNGGVGNFGDGGAALVASVGAPQNVAVDANGVVFVRTSFGGYDRIRRITPQGIITSYAGRHCPSIQSNAGLSARQACISYASNSLELAPDGTLVLNTTRQHIERIGPPQAPGGSGGQTLYVPAPNGAQVYEFNSTGRHLRTLNALTGAALYRFGYDAAGRLSTVTDYDGNVTSIERTADGRPTAIVASGGQRTVLAFNAGGYLSVVTNPAGEKTTLGYDAEGLLTTLTDARGGVHRYTYDADGRLVRDEDPAAGIKTLARFEEPGRTVVTLTTGLGSATIYATEVLSNGERLRSVTAPDGTTTRLLIVEGTVWTLTTPDGTVQRVAFGPDPRWGMNAPLAASTLITTTGGLQFSATSERTATLTEPANPFSVSQVQELVIIDGDTWRYTYYAGAGLAEVLTPEGRRFRSTLDTAGRVVTIDRDSSGALAETHLTYDSRGRLTLVAQDSRTQGFGYNDANWLISHTAPDGTSATFNRDAAGRVSAVSLPDGQVISFGYDAVGNLTGLTPPGRPQHGFTYDGADLPTRYDPPTVSGGGSAQWAYDADHNLTTFTRPGGSTLGLGYAHSGFRLANVALQRGTRTLTYDPAGRIQALSDPSGITLAYAYDGPMIVSRTQSGPVTGTVAFTYNAAWLIASVTVNGANPIAYQYDGDDLLVNAGDLTVSRNTTHGLVTGGQLGGVSDTWTYNAHAEAASYSATYNATALYGAQFQRDARGRITRNVETIGGASSTYAYAFDSVGRLVEVRKGGAVIGSYSYDGNGNRLTANGVNATYDAQDRLTQFGNTQYSYTASGELASKTTGAAVTSYQYDEAGNLMAATLPDGRQLAYRVDALNRRVGKAVNGVPVQGFLYQDAFRPVAELDGSSALVSRFVYGARFNVPEYLIKGGQTYRIIADQVGSPRLVVNVANGQVAQRLDYDAWGNVLLDTSPGFQPFGFAGGLYDRDTGLVRFGLRDYDPTSGRWTSKDPMGFGGGDSNLYAYVGNDPVNAIDPTGTEEESAPSPCNPNKPWDEKARDGLDKLKKVPDWMLQSKPVRWLKNGYNKLTKAEKLRDDAQQIYDNMTSPDPMDALDAVDKGLEYVPQPVEITPKEAVHETVRQLKKTLTDWRERMNPTPNSNNPTVRDRWYQMYGAERS